MMSSARLNMWATALAAGASFLVLGSPAGAQGWNDWKLLSDRMAVLEAQMQQMQSQQRNTQPAAGSVQRLSDRLDQLENQMRQYLNQQEQSEYNNRRMAERLDKLVADVDYRFGVLEKGGTPTVGGATPPAAGATPPAGNTADGPRDLSQPSSGGSGPMQLRTGPAPAQQQASAAAPKVTLPPGSAQDRYDFSYKLLLKGDFAGAEQAFNEWLGAYPDDKLAGNAQYWLAESSYARKDYEKAAANFLKGYQKYPKSPKAPDSLVKLGMSLTNMNQKQQACAVFRQLNADFPNPPPSVRQLAAAERARAGCSG